MAEIKRQKYWIKEGIAVAHRTNLNFMYTVKRLLKKAKNVRCDENDEGAFEKDGRWFKSRTYLDGIEVQCVNQYQEVDTTVFHSQELIPWEVAKQGSKAVNDWYKSDS